MKTITRFAVVTLAAAGATVSLAACGSSADDAPNRDADVTAACTKSLNERQKNLGLEEAKPLEGTTKIVAADGGWTMSGEVFALKGDSGAPGTASQVRFTCVAKDINGTVEASAFITLRK